MELTDIFFEKKNANEMALLEYLRGKKSELQGNPDLVLQAIDEFGQQNNLINIGPFKGAILTGEIQKQKPGNIVELGTNFGYSAILMANELVKIDADDSTVYTFEIDETLYNMAAEIIKIAGLQDRIVQIFGKASDKYTVLQDEYNIEEIGLLFIDHWKYLYVPDLRVFETVGLVTLGTTLFADNVIMPGAPEYLDYVKAPPSWKQEHNARTKNVNGIQYPGKWGLLYDSKTIESICGRGEKDGVEITKCVGVLDA